MAPRIHKRSIEEYRSVAGTNVLKSIYREAEKLHGKHFVMVNSTPVGGGVAEILNSLVLLLNSLGVSTDWRILKGTDSFFTVTKSLHNAFQGESVTLKRKEKQLYEQINYNNAQIVPWELYDGVVIHDPQPLPLIQYSEKTVPWIWRFHPDLSRPFKPVVEYLLPFIRKYDAMIATLPDYNKRYFNLPFHTIAPSIDPLTDKNKHLTTKEVNSILRRHGIKMEKPIITQISRFDKWKDPLGVVKAHTMIRKKVDCRLVLIGNIAPDDPEGPEIYDEVMQQSNRLTDVYINCEDNDLLVNALQRKSKVVLQKSLKEGFALTVSEALWKKTPVVGGEVGGIPLQVINGKTGYLVSSPKEAADACIKLLKDPGLRTRMGSRGRNHVKKNFLITRHVLDYLKLFNHYC